MGFVKPSQRMLSKDVHQSKLCYQLRLHLLWKKLLQYCFSENTVMHWTVGDSSVKFFNCVKKKTRGKNFASNPLVQLIFLLASYGVLDVFNKSSTAY